MSPGNKLGHCDLVTPYDAVEHWIGHWHGAWRHQSITRTNGDSSSTRSWKIYRDNKLTICYKNAIEYILNIRVTLNTFRFGDAYIQGIILGMGSVSERRRYNVMSYPIGPYPE